MHRNLKTRTSRFIAATVLTLVFVALRHLASPILGDEARLLIFPIPVMLSAWLGGFGAGLFATALSGVFGYLLFMGPRPGITPLDMNEAAHLALFLIEGVLAAYFADRFRFQQRQVESSETRANAEHAAFLESEKRIRRLIDSHVFGVLFYTPDGTISNANDLFLQMVGYTREEMRQGKIRWRDMTPPEWKEVNDEAWRDLLEIGYCAPFEKEYYRKDGSRVPVIVGAANIDSKDMDGIAYVLDISDRKRIEAMLKESQERLSQALEATGLGTWDFNPATNGLVWDTRTREVHGVDPDAEITFDLYLSRIYHEDRPGVIEAIEQAMRPGQGENFYVEFRTVASESAPERWVSGNGRVIFDAEGKPQRFIGLSEDITEKKRAEEALRRTSEQLETLVQARTLELTNTNKELEAFSYSVSHDLRTPLRSIEGFSQALLEDELQRLSERGQKDLQRIRAASQRMGRIIDDLLSLSRLSRAEMRRQNIDLAEIAQRTFAALTSQDPLRKIEFQLASLHPAYGDEGLVYILLENLLGNAWKFTGQAAHPRIEIGSYEKDSEVVYFVKDNGVGFDMAYYDKLFGAFQRLHRMTEFSGTGIGLATARRAVHRHGGRIWAESKIGQGATFYFTLGVPSPKNRDLAHFREKTL